MTTTVFNSDGSTLVSLKDGTVDSTTTSLSLPGRGYVSYGSIICSDLVALLENFANDVAPTSPQVGQLWFRTKYNDTSGDSKEYNRLLVYTGQLSSDTLDPNDPNDIVPTGWTDVGTKIYTNISGPIVQEIGDIWFKKTSTDGEYQQFFWNGSDWQSLGGVQISETPPIGSGGVSGSAPVDGTMWWMIPECMMWVYDSSVTSPSPSFYRVGGDYNGTELTGGWRLIGPECPININTQQYWAQVEDTSGSLHDVLVNEVDGNIIDVKSSSTFTMASSGRILSNFSTYSNTYSPTNTSIIVTGTNVNQSSGSSISGTISNSKYFDNNVPLDFIGRGENTNGNYTASPSYPYSDAQTDLGSSSNRWNNNYSVRYYGSSFTSSNMASTSSPNWNEIDFIGNASSSINSQYLQGLQPSSFIGRGGSGDPVSYPKTDNVTDLGSSSNRWKTLYSSALTTTTINSSGITTTNLTSTNISSTELTISDTGNIQNVVSTSVTSSTFSGGIFYGSGFGPNNIPTTTNYNTINFIGNAYSSSFSNQASHADSASKWDNGSSIQISGDVVSSSQTINSNGNYNFSTSISQNGCGTVKNYLLSNNVFVTPDTLNNEVNVLNGEISSIQQTDTNLQNEINTINSNIGTTGDAAGSSTVYGAINRNSASINTINNEITSIQATDSSLQSQINSVKTSIGSSSDAAGANTVYGAINKNENSINNLNSEVAAIQQLDTNFANEISDIYSRIGNTGDSTSGNSVYSHINANTSSIDNINGEISTIQNTDVSLQNQITANKIGRMLNVPQTIAGSNDSSGTMTVALNSETRYIRVYGCGAGGAGGSAWYNGTQYQASAATGGGAGASAEFWVDVSAAGISGSVVLTAGQAGNPNSDSSQSGGGNGGSSYFNGGGTTIILNGGYGGPHCKTTGTFNMAGQGAGGQYSVSGTNGLYVMWIKFGESAHNGIVLNGSSIPSFGGNSPYGSGGYNGNNAAGNGESGYGAGGPGAGADGSSNSGNSVVEEGSYGTPGRWVIEQYS